MHFISETPVFSRSAVLLGCAGIVLSVMSAVAHAGPASNAATSEPAASVRDTVREIVIVHTNDFESAIDPLTAFWVEGSPQVGGAAHLAARIDAMRREELAKGNPLFLFDSGDMFTGLLSRLTYGEILMEMMISMRYDAMAIGNHEFDYGSENFLRQAHRVPFPVLSANTFFKGTEHHYTRPHTIIERDGVRIGVIGILGEDAASVALPSGITDLEFRDPIPYVRRSAEELDPLVDLIVVLAHQGKTGPMQSDQEADPEVWRDFDADIALVEAVPQVDLFLGGHAHRGIDPPYVHPETGAIISQTFGHGTRLGVFRLWVDVAKNEVVRHEGGLITPYTAEYLPDAALEAKVRHYKDRYRDDIETPVGELAARLIRKYNRESSLGNFVADVIRSATGAEVGLANAGGLRADLSPGTVTRGAVIDALPFLNSVVAVEMTGAQLIEILEHGFSLERGMIQVSGLVAKVDLERPIGHRLVSLEVGGVPVDEEHLYRVATNSFLAEGGDFYTTFVGLPWVAHDQRPLSEVVIEAFEQHDGVVPLPAGGRILRVQELP
jgi:2',3'-cyclic-nucleotide 2'-phosphodiesterase (5'-nucleotidase family)